MPANPLEPLICQWSFSKTNQSVNIDSHPTCHEKIQWQISVPWKLPWKLPFQTLMTWDGSIHLNVSELSPQFLTSFQMLHGLTERGRKTRRIIWLACIHTLSETWLGEISEHSSTAWVTKGFTGVYTEKTGSTRRPQTRHLVMIQWISKQSSFFWLTVVALPCIADE